MGLKIANNAVAKLATGIASTDTSFSVEAGKGALFPVIGTGDYFYATLEKSDFTNEIVKVTARSTDAFTVVRGQDGSVAKSFSADDVVECRIIKTMVETAFEHPSVATGAHLASAIASTATGNLASTNVQAALEELQADVDDRSIPQNSKSENYTTVLGDADSHILHPASDNNARTFTIDSNANVPYPIGTAITFVNKINVLTIAITADTLTFAGAGSTGSRTLAANGMATALKITSTEWIISGTGLT